MAEGEGTRPLVVQNGNGVHKVNNHSHDDRLTSLEEKVMTLSDDLQTMRATFDATLTELQNDLRGLRADVTRMLSRVRELHPRDFPPN